ncbi:hypothetical protein GALL_492180 [mine drainage metagenome]|uniref:Uncharacterized protein n=1 Tax=mine drainage metagenome TaxID=410659 RepID=A0A1J5PCX5_9ZZZZ
MEVQEVGENVRGNEYRGWSDLDVAQHFAGLHFEIAVDGIFYAATDHIVEVHVRVEKHGLHLNAERVAVAVDLFEKFFQVGQIEPCHLWRQARIVQFERRSKGACIGVIFDFPNIRDTLYRLLVYDIGLGDVNFRE